MDNKVQLRKKEPNNKVNLTALAGAVPLTGLPGAAAVLTMLPKEEKVKYRLRDIEKATGVSGTEYYLKKSRSALEGGYAPEFANSTKKKLIIGSRKRPTVLAHEMGHMSSKLTNSKLGLGAYTAGKLSTMASPLYGAYKGSKGEKLTNKERAVAYLMALPMVAEESRANFIAARAGYRLGGKKGLLRALPTVLASQLSYLGAAGGLDISNYIARKLKKPLEKKN